MISRLLLDTVEVYRPTLVADGRGGRTRSFASVGVVRAKVGQPSTDERATAARLGAVLSAVVHVAFGADVRRGDELDVGHPRRVRVVSVTTNSRRTYARIECEEVQGGD